MVRRQFKNLLHKDDYYKIYFAKRGKSDRTAALRTALETARQRFADLHGIESAAPIDILPTTLAHCHGLEVVDYFLWALQRFYERREGRYVQLCSGHLSASFKTLPTLARSNVGSTARRGTH